MDEPLSEPDADAQRQHPGYDGSEGDVGEQSRTREIVEMGKKWIQHDLIDFYTWLWLIENNGKSTIFCEWTLAKKGQNVWSDWFGVRNGIISPLVIRIY